MLKTEIEKIKELLREFHPEDSEKELQEKATNLWEISLFLVRFQIKNNLEKADGKIINIIPRDNSP